MSDAQVQFPYPAYEGYPSEFFLFTIPGFRTDDLPSTGSGRLTYYSQLMQMNWLHDPQSTEDLYNQHRRMFSKEKVKLAEFNVMVDSKQIPSLPDVDEWDENNPPFASMEQCNQALLLEVCRAIDQASTKWDIVGPCSINYEGTILHFVGLESFKLEAVRIKNLHKDFEKKGWSPELAYYFRRLDSAVVTKFYGLSQETAVKMFGSPFAKTFGQMHVAVASSSKWQKAIQEMTRRQTAERYAGTGMEFGGW